MMKKNERIDIVPGTEHKIIQDKSNFSYGTDAIFLSNIVKAKGKIVDLGTGSGIIPLRLINKKNINKIYGIEIQKEVADLAKKSIKLNNLDEKIEILNMDLKNLKDKFKKHSIDIVTCNPPYMKKGDALVNKEENFAISRHEIACNFEDILDVSAYLLKPLGKLYLVHRPNRLVDIFFYMRKYKIEPKWIRFVQAKREKRPNLILIEAVKNGKIDLKFHDPLIVYGEDGKYTDEIYKIYENE